MKPSIILRPPLQSKQDLVTLHLPISKSLMARRMLLNALTNAPERIECQAEYPEDIQAIHTALEQARNGASTISVRESGTAMRLMAAYLSATTATPTRLEGEGRQHQRPIAPLVSALRALGARVTYLGEEGYPPLLIEPSRLTARHIELDASASSQYLSALLLIAPRIGAKGYTIDTRQSGLASAPYALMTEGVMREYGYDWSVRDGVFTYEGCRTDRTAKCSPEADWSAASYAYQQVALGVCKTLHLPNLQLPSLQGDSLYLSDVFGALGVVTTPYADGILLKQGENRSAYLRQDCGDCPDLVPTFVGICLALSVPFCLTGVGHLRIKESDRLQVLQDECRKLGSQLQITEQTIAWEGAFMPIENPKDIALDPHGDHRMAMALAPIFAHRLGEVAIITPEVVGKSFPKYWQSLLELDYTISAKSES